ncbi:MAG: Gfo/Idh/MocA family oxidoreductase, partial [Planctomycetales bacterium]|nr:Gfo/Idh/MocA family oxidoreductase [Planctomycetales bacterium]
MAQRNDRRDFLKTSAAIGAGYWVAGSAQAKESKSANEQIQFACIGVGGKGSSDSNDAFRRGKIIAMADIDENTLNAKAKVYKDAKPFFDYREMLDELGDKIDAVTVSTPDHHHAPAAALAMKHNCHAFVQKPLTRSIYEARFLGDLAREKGLATMMGNQGTANSGLRKAAATIQAGAIGNVTEVHVWTNRPVWPQGGDRPEPQDVPAHVKWELFLGPAPYRPYAAGYHPFKWRGWWDFGTGALGDMACHTFNMPFAALDLRDPTSVVATTSGHNGDSYPK